VEARAAERGSRLLVELALPERRPVEEALLACPRVRVPANRPAANDALADAALLVVEKGVVAVLSEGGPVRRPILLALGSDGGLLVPPIAGEVVLALVEAELTVVTARAQRALLASPAAAGALLRGLAQQTGDHQTSLAILGMVSHVERVRAKLLQLARTHGRVARGGSVVIDLPLTHELLGMMVGSARETVTTALRALAEEGFVTRDGRRYRLSVSPTAL
jgi:hypothetical protein